MAVRPGTGGSGGRQSKREIITWTETALRDLEEIGDYISRDDLAASAAWVGKLMDTARRAATFPHAARIVPKIDRVLTSGIRVLTVFEGHRRLPSETNPDA